METKSVTNDSTTTLDKIADGNIKPLSENLNLNKREEKIVFLSEKNKVVYESCDESLHGHDHLIL